MPAALMNLKVLLPYAVFTSERGVSRIIAESSSGAFGLLPHRLDCVTILRPGILVYDSKKKGEIYLAVDEGVLVKSGLDVLVSVHQAVSSPELSRLREVVEREFRSRSDQEQDLRTAMAKIESSFMRGLKEFYSES
jgi:F-type H+-transporting ATPase subunit epsilon